MSLWDRDKEAPPPPASWDDTPKPDNKKRPPPRKMGRAVALPGPVCPDCETGLFLEDGRHDAPYCMGCAPDPGVMVHYVGETYLRRRLERRQIAALAMAEAAKTYNAARPAPLTDVAVFIRDDWEMIPLDEPPDGSWEPDAEIEPEAFMDDLPI